MKNLLFILLGFIVTSCKTTGSLVTKNNKISINKTQWILEDELSKHPEITFNIENGRVYGNAGCNDYFAEIHTDDSDKNLFISNIGATRKSCDNISTESRYLSVLEKVTNYRISENELHLYKDRVLLMKFKRK